MKRSFYNKFFLVFVFLIIEQLISNFLQAQNTYLDSLKTALSKATTSLDSIQILCHLTWESYSVAPETTLMYGTKALSLVKGNEDGRIISEAYDAAAQGYWATKDIPKAIRLYSVSLDIGQKNKLPVRIAWGNYNLAQLAMQENQPDSAFAFAQKSAAAFHDAKMDDWMISSYWVMLKNINGDRRLSFYHEMIAKIESIIQTTTDENQLTMRYLDLSSIYNKLENRSKSLEYVLKALEVAEKNNNEKGILSAYASIAAYLRDIQHNQTVALQYYQKILETYRKYNKTWAISDVLIDIGIVYKEMQKDSMAIVSFSESLHIAEKYDYPYQIMRTYLQMGDIYYRKGNYPEALSLFLKSYHVECKNCKSFFFYDVLIQLGKVYSQLGDFEKSYQYYQRSFQIADSIADSQYKAISLTSLGDWNMLNNDIKAATNDYQLALENASKTNNLTLQIKISDKLSENYAQQHDYQKAYRYKMLSDKLEDSVRMVNETENLARFETLFEFQNLRMQKEVENAKSEAEIGKQVLIRNLFIAGFIVMSLLGVYLFLSFRRKKKDNILLANQKKKIEEMSEKIHHADKLKLQFFTNISHEFRTPLTLITGLTDELSNDEMSENTWKNKVRIIQKNTSRLLHLVNQILDIRKLDNGDGVIELTRDDLVKFVGGIVTLFEDYAKRKNVELKFVSEQNEMVINSDFDKLDKILSNLISNAVKYCNENDHVRVTLYTEFKPSPAFIIEVEDTGRGIPADQLQYIFQPFYQVTDSEGGSGIGLALVREMVTLLQGHIDIRSQLDFGTRVTIKIPFDQSQNHVETSSHPIKTGHESWKEVNTNPYTSEEGKSPEINECGGNGDPENGYEKSLLIVEDNTDLLEFVAGIMVNEFKILKATDGKKGLQMAIKCIPDIIVSDIMMPVMDGMQMCGELKNNPCTSHIPILFLTAKTDQDSMLQGYKIGADDYIIKPFSAVLLKSRIQNLVNQRRKLIEKFSRQFQVEPTALILPDADKCFLEKSIRVIETHMDNPELDIDLLASEMNVSRTQLYRKLKALTDCSGNKFIRVIRLKRAAQLLSQNQLTIAEVMQQTGFSNYSYFNQCFNEQFNSFPKDYFQYLQANN